MLVNLSDSSLSKISSSLLGRFRKTYASALGTVKIALRCKTYGDANFSLPKVLEYVILRLPYCTERDTILARTSDRRVFMFIS